MKRQTGKQTDRQTTCMYLNFVAALIFDVFKLDNFIFSSYFFLRSRICFSGPGSSVVTATGYGLDGPGIESRWGLWGPPSLRYNGYRVFPGGRKRPGRDADPSSLSSAEV
jgi:hypothetical protein